MKKTMYITSIITLILLISISFAWMTDVVAPSGHFPIFRFDKTLYVASSDLDVDLSTEIDDEYVSIDNLRSNGLFQNENLGPGSIQKYKLTITNNSSVTMNLSLVLSDISTSYKDFYKNIYIGIFSVSGFEGYYDAPKVNEFNLNDKIKDGSCNLVENCTLPNDKATVEIRFYIRIDYNATNDIQDQWFQVRKLNIVVI